MALILPRQASSPPHSKGVCVRLSSSPHKADGVELLFLNPHRFSSLEEFQIIRVPFTHIGISVLVFGNIPTTG